MVLDREIAISFLATVDVPADPGSWFPYIGSKPEYRFLARHVVYSGNPQSAVRSETVDRTKYAHSLFDRENLQIYCTHPPPATQPYSSQGRGIPDTTRAGTESTLNEWLKFCDWLIPLWEKGAVILRESTYNELDRRNLTGGGITLLVPPQAITACALLLARVNRVLRSA